MKNEIVWDRTNIGENYPGVTAPLTYSFIRDAYSNVYANFLKKLGVNKNRIRRNSHILTNMLGYVEGHIFYNIENWYRFMKLLPGYKYNKDFFEAMLDPVVKKKVDRSEKTSVSKMEGYYILAKFIWSILFFKKILLRQFDNKFDVLYSEFQELKLTELTHIDLINQFNKTEKQFFKIWAHTIFNDFKVMIFYGILKKYSQKFGEESENILRDVYSLKNQPRSILPLQEIIQLSLQIKQNSTFTKLFNKPSGYILGQLSRMEKSPIKDLFDTYLKEYGERSSNELKLEEPKFKDKPELFIELLKNYMEIPEDTLYALLKSGETKQELYVPESASLFDRWIIRILKKITVNGIYLREYFRMKRGRVFGIARDMFIEMGRRMKENGDLSNTEDIFYLYKQELFDYIQFHSLPVNLKEIVERRKKQLEDYRQIKMPRKVSTKGLPNENDLNRSYQMSKELLTGMITSKGNVTADVIVMDRLDLSADFRNKILVTTATDPGWTVIFPLLKGVITEQGGVLSHASIIAREINIPCIVQVHDVTSRLKTGQTIHMDAMAGKIHIVH